MQSKKRFTETNIWEARFYMELDPVQKVFWQYVNDRCDNIGVWTPNFRLAAFNCGIEGDVRIFTDSFLEAVNIDDERIRVLDNGSWFLPEFTSFQYGKLNPNNRAHLSYLNLMQQHGLTDFFKENYPEILPDNLELSEDSIRTLKEVKERRIEKEKEKDGEKVKDVSNHSVNGTKKYDSTKFASSFKK